MDPITLERPEVRTRTSSIPLFQASPGQWLRISRVPGGPVMAQFIRFGIHEGQRVRCIERLPGGTVVLQKNRQQIAIGHTLARQVFVVVIAGEA
jgi:Fe2+ transport system protein FeoA